MSESPDQNSETPRSSEDEPLAAAVKSAILDRLISDLRCAATLSAPHSFYAKSDSGLYGKYQKVDTRDLVVLEAIHAALGKMVEESADADTSARDSADSAKDT